MADCHEPRPLEGLKILLADDTAVIRHLYSTALSRAGARVTVAANGEQAFVLWRAALRVGSPFDVVVLDYAMPVTDGGVVTATKQRCHRRHRMVQSPHVTLVSL